MPIPRGLRRTAIATVGCGVAFVGVVGFAHTDAGRPLLRYLPGMGSTCPVQTAMAPEERDRLRGELLAGVRGADHASSRAALRFELGTTTRTDVAGWASTHAIACTQDRNATLRCTDVPAAALGIGLRSDELSFVFDAHDELVALDSSSRVDDAETAASFASRRTEELRARLGDPSSIAGEATAAFVGRGPLTQVSAEFRRAELRAKVVATNLGHGRFTVRELYQALPG
jgi:hypothetical protein